MRTKLAISLLAIVFLSACNGKTSNINSNSTSTRNANTTVTPKPPDPIKSVGVVDPNFKPCNPYFPLVPGSQAKYTINFSSGLVADATVVVAEVEEGGRKVFIETTQIVDRSGGLQKSEMTVRKYYCEGERVQLFYERTDNRIEDKQVTVEAKFGPSAVVMAEPAEMGRKGATWSYSFNQVYQSPGEAPMSPDEPIVILFEVQGPEEVSTPAGKFNTVRILRKVGQAQLTDSYARGIGLVKRVNAEGTKWDLREYSGLKPLD